MLQSQFKLLVVKQCPLMSRDLLGNQKATFFQIFLDEWCNHLLKTIINNKRSWEAVKSTRSCIGFRVRWSSVSLLSLCSGINLSTLMFVQEVSKLNPWVTPFSEILSQAAKSCKERKVKLQTFSQLFLTSTISSESKPRLCSWSGSGRALGPGRWGTVQ